MLNTKLGKSGVSLRVGRYAQAHRAAKTHSAHAGDAPSRERGPQARLSFAQARVPPKTKTSLPKAGTAQRTTQIVLSRMRPGGRSLPASLLACTVQLFSED